MIPEDNQPNRALLVGLNTTHQDAIWSLKESLDELKELARTADIESVKIVTQSLSSPNKKSYVGKGKLEEIKELVHTESINMLITDDELTPSQHKHIEQELEIKVIDRTGLILDIFARRAQTHEAKLQIELAQLEYLLPRLTHLWTHLSRIRGGIGARGPGETQLESDKRQIGKRVSFIKKKLNKVQKERALRREKRDSIPAVTIALVGYTNSGKSTLMNRLTTANVLAENKLFATLDPTTRQFHLPSNDDAVLTDTVGFIQKLPHHLVKAFFSTLEEVTCADFILHVIDASHTNLEGIIQTSQALIESLNATQIPTVYVFNKWDQVTKPNTLKTELSSRFSPCIFISALKDESLEPLTTAIQNLLAPFKRTMHFLIPYNRMDIMNLLHQHGHIINTDYQESIHIEVEINAIKGQKIMDLLGTSF